MITIAGYLHRGALQHLIRRWMYHRAEPGDADAIRRLVYFNNAYVSRYLKVFVEQLFGQLHPGPLIVRPSRRKADLKDAIVMHCQAHNARIDEMLTAYRRQPGMFYRETPFHGLLYFVAQGNDLAMVGSGRIKRARRLGEKIARRIIDQIYATIKDRAELLARERALRAGVPVDALITPAEEMIAEFLGAETRLLEDLKHGRPIFTDTPLVIQDVAGVKMIVPDGQRPRLLERIARMEGCRIIEIEEHRGRYNAVNLIIRYTPDREALTQKPLSAAMVQRMQQGGCDPAQVQERFQAFVLSAEDHVHLEVILCNYQEMLESELGRCMHEDRIEQQRITQQYNGQLARNVEFLIAYLFAFAASSRTEMGPLPIRLWDRYLPDYFDEVLTGLYRIPRVEVME